MSDSAAVDAAKGPSKKELNKLARKNKPAAPSTDNARFTVLFCKGASPDLCRAVELHLCETGSVKYVINKAATEPHVPLMKSVAESDSWSISGDENIARYLVRSSANAGLYGHGDAVLASQIDQWMSVYDRSMCCASVRDSLVTLVDTHMNDKTFFVGAELTLADMAILIALRKINFTANFETVPHASRWFEMATSSIATWVPIPVSVMAPPAGAAAEKKEKKTTATKDKAVEEDETAGDKGSCPPLEGAVEGQVCTRFPPEPSGYLHIGKFNFHHSHRYTSISIFKQNYIFCTV